MKTHVRSIIKLCLGLTFLAIVSPAMGQEETFYDYDARGRVLVADSRAASGAGFATGYGFDAAGNRTVEASVLVTKVGGLSNGQAIGVGEGIVSRNLAYRLTLQFDGNLVLYSKPNQAEWATMSFNPASGQLVMQSDGNLVLYEGSNAVWSSNTWGHPGAFFAVQNDGNMVVYGPDGKALWARSGS